MKFYWSTWTHPTRYSWIGLGIRVIKLKKKKEKKKGITTHVSFCFPNLPFPIDTFLLSLTSLFHSHPKPIFSCQDYCFLSNPTIQISLFLEKPTFTINLNASFYALVEVASPLWQSHSAQQWCVTRRGEFLRLQGFLEWADLVVGDGNCDNRSGEADGSKWKHNSAYGLPHSITVAKANGRERQRQDEGWRRGGSGLRVR